MLLFKQSFFLHLRHLAIVLVLNLFCAVCPPGHAAPEPMKPFSLPLRPRGLGPNIDDRAAWNRVAKWPLFQTTLAQAEAMLLLPVPVVSDDDYLEYSRTGARTRHTLSRNARSLRLQTLTLAECLENRGRFLAAIEEVLQTTLAEKTWVDNAHDSKLANFKGRNVEIDLEVAKTALATATAYALLGERLSPATRSLVLRELERRVFAPYRAMLDGSAPAKWLGDRMNWNAICLAGVTGAALAVLPSPEERTVFVKAALKYNSNYLAGFDGQGYSSEGLGYWNYGFEHYLLLARMLFEATGGQIDLFAQPKVRQIALFLARFELSAGVYPAFADSHADEAPHPWILNMVAHKYSLPRPDWKQALAPLPEAPFYGEFLYEPVGFAFADLSPIAGSSAPEPRDRSWFARAGVLVCRRTLDGDKGGPFAVALKGGRDVGSHSHRDVGTFVVAVGQSALLLDVGREIYTARSFSGQRYQSAANNSFGHSVPRVAGELQSGEPKPADARWFEPPSFTPEADTFALDLKPFYAVPSLQNLRRIFRFERAGAAALTVRDEFTFDSPQTFETALLTFSSWKQAAPGRLLVGDGRDAVQIEIEAQGGTIEVNAEAIKENFHNKKHPVRLGLRFTQPLQQGAIQFKITPLAPKQQ